MCLRTVFLALAVTAVDSRPQFGNPFQPLVYQQPFVPLNPDENVYGERTMPYFNFVHQIDAALNSQFFDPETRRPQVYDRQTEVISISERVNRNPSNDNQNGFANENEKTNANRQTHLQNGQPAKTNAAVTEQMNKQLEQAPNYNNTGKKSIKTNKDKETQYSTANTPSDNQEPTPTSHKAANETQANVYKNSKPKTGSDNRSVNTAHKTNEVYRSNANNTEQIRKTVSTNDNAYITGSSNSSEVKLVSANPPVLKVPTNGPEERTIDEDNKDEDRWVWGISEVTEKEETTTPDLDDRASFDGGTCPTGKIKVGGMCVDVD